MTGDPRNCNCNCSYPIKSYDWPVGYAIKNIAFKRLDANAKAPTRNLETDAGMDLYALEDVEVPSLFKLAFFLTMFRLQEWFSKWWFQREDLRDIIELDFMSGFGATKVKTGIALEIPVGMYGKIEDRSSMGSKLLKTLGGVIDSEYRGDITICLANLSFRDYQIKAGDKVAQIIFHKYEALQPYETTELSESNRGENGFGSSGT